MLFRSKVFAPFAGVITKRNVDTGALITSGNTSQQQLFYLSQTAPLKVLIPVPEAYALAIKPGVPVTIETVQQPGKKIAGKVTRSAEVIDPQTRTLLTQIDIPNADGALMPGAYVQVHVKLAVASERMQVPVNTLLFRSEGIRVAVVDDKNVVHLQPITIGRDFGTTVEVVLGLSVTDWIVINPSDSLADKQTVQIGRAHV